MTVKVTDIASLEATKPCFLPVFVCPVTAGFPSPADDWLEDPLDFNELLIRRPAATFVLTVSGDSMSPTIADGDKLVVDRSLVARAGDIVVAAVAGDLTVKRLGDRCLIPDNSAYRPIDIGDDEELVIWGVVKHIIRSV